MRLRLLPLDDRGGDRRGVGRSSRKTLDDRAGGVARDLGDIGHRPGARRLDLALGCGELGGEFVLQDFSLGLRVGRGGLASGLGEALRFRARLGQRPLMRSRGRVRPLMRRRRVVEVARDLGFSALDHRAELGQGALGHEPVEEAEGDREPDELRRKRAGVERRKGRMGAALLADRRLRRVGGRRLRGLSHRESSR